MARIDLRGCSRWPGFKPEGLAHPLPGAKPPESVFPESKGLKGRHTNEYEYEYELKLKLKLKFELKFEYEYWIGRGEGVDSVLVPDSRELRFARKQQNLKNPGKFR